jgi:hypothetical protein
MVAVVGFRLTLGENEVVLLDETIKGVLGKVVDVAGGSKGCQGSKTESVLHCERIRILPFSRVLGVCMEWQEDGLLARIFMGRRGKVVLVSGEERKGQVQG